MDEKKPVYLIMVTPDNHNKYYRFIPNGDYFTAEYGRVGSSCQTKTYPIRQWDKKYNEKIKKGYVDQTHLMQDLIQEVKPKSQSEYKEIENESIAEIVERLQKMARQKVQANYKISSQQVTTAMVDEAQKVIDRLMNIEEVEQFNKTLIELFGVIPRKMPNVASYLASKTEDFSRILKDEQDLLDVMRGQVITHVAQETEPEEKSATTNDKTILEAMGLVFEEVDEREISMIKSKLGEIKDKFYQAWKVRNIATQARFDRFVEQENIKDCRLFWHGSRNENWWSIINMGLVLRPVNVTITGKMFGLGEYFSPTARKSFGYTSYSGSYWARGNSDSAFMALLNVAYGKPYDVYSFDNKYSSFNYEKLKEVDKDANCLHAHAGSMLRNDEVVIYKEDQCTIQYLVELR